MNMASQPSLFTRLLAWGLAALLIAAGLFAHRPAVSAQTPPTLVWNRSAASTDTNWSNAENWVVQNTTTRRAPQDGDWLRFDLPGATDGLVMQNNISGLQLAGITFNAYNLNLNGQAFSTNQVQLSSSGYSVTLYTPLALEAQTGVTVATGSTLNLIGEVTGTGSLSKDGPGILLFSSAKTFSGGVEIKNGMARTFYNGGLGSGPVTVGATGTLDMQQVNFSLTNPLTLAGRLILHQTGAVSGPLTVQGSQATMEVRTVEPIYLTGAIGGADSGSTLTLTNNTAVATTIELAGEQPNTFAGTIKLARGNLRLNKPAGVTAVAGNLAINNEMANPQDNGGFVTVQANNQFSPLTRIAFGPYTRLYLNGTSQTLHGLSAYASSKPCSLNMQSGHLTIQTRQPGNTFLCSLSGGGSIEISGDGLQDFTRADDESWEWAGGSLTVHSGASYLDRIKMGGLYRVEASGYGGMDHGAETARVEVDGSRFFGLSTADLPNKTGDLLVSGSGSRLYVTLKSAGGPALVVTGVVVLNQGSLAVNYSDPYAPAIGQPRVLIQNEGTDPISGTFEALPEGSPLTLTPFQASISYPLRVSYRGGDGNDLAVTRLVRSTLDLTTLPAYPAWRGPVTLRAHLQLQDQGSFAQPSAPVAFYDGEKLLGTAFVTAGDAYLLNVQLGPGTHILQARLIGDALYADAYSNSIPPHAVFLPVTVR